MKKVLFIVIIAIFSAFPRILFSQQDIVDISSSGTGRTFDEAKQNALRSAIEMAFGTFVSANSELLNDELITDNISTVASGNIVSYEVLSKSELPDNYWGVTIKTKVSVGKLVSFVESKGYSSELKGSLFSLNIKQQILNEQAEINSVFNLCGVLHESLQKCFNYSIITEPPQSIDQGSSNWHIRNKITVTSNDNITKLSEYLVSTLSGISLNKTEASEYKKLKKPVFNVSIRSNGKIQEFSLRKNESLSLLNTVFSQWDFYLRSFEIINSLETVNGEDRNRILDDPGIMESLTTSISKKEKYLSEMAREEKNKYNTGYTGMAKNLLNSVIGEIISLPSANKEVKKFVFIDRKTLKEIDKLTGYKINPLQPRNLFKEGGIPLENQTIMAPMEFQIKDLAEVKPAVEGLNLAGSKGWRIPNVYEMASLMALMDNPYGGVCCGKVNYYYKEKSVKKREVGYSESDAVKMAFGFPTSVDKDGFERMRIAELSEKTGYIFEHQGELLFASSNGFDQFMQLLERQKHYQYPSEASRLEETNRFIKNTFRIPYKLDMVEVKLKPVRN